MHLKYFMMVSLLFCGQILSPAAAPDVPTNPVMSEQDEIMALARCWDGLCEKLNMRIDPKEQHSQDIAKVARCKKLFIAELYSKLKEAQGCFVKAYPYLQGHNDLYQQILLGIMSKSADRYKFIFSLEQCCGIPLEFSLAAAIAFAFGDQLSEFVGKSSTLSVHEDTSMIEEHVVELWIHKNQIPADVALKLLVAFYNYDGVETAELDLFEQRRRELVLLKRATDGLPATLVNLPACITNLVNQIEHQPSKENIFEPYKESVLKLFDLHELLMKMNERIQSQWAQKSRAHQLSPAVFNEIVSKIPQLLVCPTPAVLEEFFKLGECTPDSINGIDLDKGIEVIFDVLLAEKIRAGGCLELSVSHVQVSPKSDPYAAIVRAMLDGRPTQDQVPSPKAVQDHMTNSLVWVELKKYISWYNHSDQLNLKQKNRWPLEIEMLPSWMQVVVNHLYRTPAGVPAEMHRLQILDKIHVVYQDMFGMSTKMNKLISNPKYSTLKLTDKIIEQLVRDSLLKQSTLISNTPNNPRIFDAIVEEFEKNLNQHLKLTIERKEQRDREEKKLAEKHQDDQEKFWKKEHFARVNILEEQGSGRAYIRDRAQQELAQIAQEERVRLNADRERNFREQFVPRFSEWCSETEHVVWEHGAKASDLLREAYRAQEEGSREKIDQEEEAARHALAKKEQTSKAVAEMIARNQKHQELHDAAQAKQKLVADRKELFADGFSDRAKIEKEERDALPELHAEQEALERRHIDDDQKKQRRELEKFKQHEAKTLLPKTKRQQHNPYAAKVVSLQESFGDEHSPKIVAKSKSVTMPKSSLPVYDDLSASGFPEDLAGSLRPLNQGYLNAKSSQEVENVLDSELWPPYYYRQQYAAGYPVMTNRHNRLHNR